MSSLDVAQATPKVALITGASHRLGAEIAETLHARGMRVVLHYHHSAEGAAALHAKLAARRAESVLSIAADLALDADRTALITQIQTTWGRLDILVNNAAIFFPTPVATSTVAQWHRVLGVNLEAPYFLSQAALPLLRVARGSIINLCDVYAERPRPDYPIYCISKAGLLGLTRALARDLAPEVRVNAVSPGAILWSADASSAEQQAILSRTPLGRSGSAADIAGAVQYLIDAPYVTGQIIAVDGGRSIYD